jgi:hypothetical protein
MPGWQKHHSRFFTPLQAFAARYCDTRPRASDFALKWPEETLFVYAGDVM